MSHNKKFTRKFATYIVGQEHPGFDRSTEGDQARHGGFRPAEFAGQVYYRVDELVALDRQQTLIAEGCTVRHAGEQASRLYSAMAAHPDADRLALVTLANGNRFALPADQFDGSTGFSSGVPIREVLVIDVRNLRERIVGMIDAAGMIVGADDEG